MARYTPGPRLRQTATLGASTGSHTPDDTFIPQLGSSSGLNLTWIHAPGNVAR
jgi:hypothetical protein